MSIDVVLIKQSLPRTPDTQASPTKADRLPNLRIWVIFISSRGFLSEIWPQVKVRERER